MSTLSPIFAFILFRIIEFHACKVKHYFQNRQEKNSRKALRTALEVRSAIMFNV